MPVKTPKRAKKPKAPVRSATKQSPRLAPGQTVVMRDYKSPAGHPKISGLAYRASMGKNVFSSDVNQYAAASFFPFSDEAVGARVPEPFAVRTRTTRVVTPFRVTPGQTGSAKGIFDAVVLPNVLNTVVSNVGTWTGGAPTQFLYVPGGQYPGSMLACTTQANLAATYSNYRVVASGIRIKSDSSYVNTAGRIFVAVVPSMAQAPGYLDSNASITDLYSAVGAPCDTSVAGTSGFNGVINSDIVSYPLAEEFSVTQLMETGGIEIIVPRTSARATDFLAGNIYSLNNGDGWQGYALQGSVGTASIGGTQYEGNSTTVLSNVQPTNAVHVVNGAYTIDYSNLARCGVDPTIYNTAGFSSVLIRGDGLDVNTVLTVEVIFHLEGEVASVSSGTGTSTVLIDTSAMKSIAPRSQSEAVNMMMGVAHPIAAGLKECGRAILPAVKAYVSNGLKARGMAGAAGVLGLLM